MTRFEDIDPPSFQFGRGRGEKDPEEPLVEEPGFEEEPQAVPEPPPEPEGDGKRGRPRLIPQMSETTARVVVAIPWVLFAIAIVRAGGAAFALAMVVLSILGLREFFRMSAATRPIMLPGYAVVAGMVIAAHFGGAF